MLGKSNASLKNNFQKLIYWDIAGKDSDKENVFSEDEMIYMREELENTELENYK
jgi:hypothetical protein